MVRHIVMWKFREEFTDEERQMKAKELKRMLEALKRVIPGISHIEVMACPLASSSADAMLYSTFESEKALSEYQGHEAHLNVKAFVKTISSSRMCMDYEV